MNDFPKTQIKILIVEDETIIYMDIAQRLKDLGYNVISHERYGKNVYSIVENIKPDLILMDINLEGSFSGIEAVKQIKGEAEGYQVKGARKAIASGQIGMCAQNNIIYVLEGGA